MPTHELHTRHPRSYQSNRFVYPVLSRRSAGISLGINLNPDKVCNFDCVYCQVNRREQAETQFVETDALLSELTSLLEMASSGEIFQHPPFDQTPAQWRRLNDVAFSGDGEPTTFRNFDEVIERCAEVKRQRGLDDVKMVLITNASMFHRPHVERGLAILDANQGEIWAKLDAGTQEYFEQVDRTPIPFRQILENIAVAARRRPLVIQSLFMRLHGQLPTDAELEAYCDRLNAIQASGGALSLVQVYTIARQPAESFASPLSDAEIDSIVELVQRRTQLPTAGFYGCAEKT
ncbi:MAG: radical SAM protein [Planctomycetales bacterium]|nr:radical SAM protein [Planctomycetales bacterium]